MSDSNELNWIDLGFKIHEQTHIYWKTIFAVPLLIIGWSNAAKNINILSAWLIVILVVALELFLTQALLKVYTLMHSSFKEIKNKNNKDKGPFYLAIHELKLLKKWQIISVNFFMAGVSCSSVLYAAYNMSPNK